MSRILLIHVSDVHFGAEFYANRNHAPGHRPSTNPPGPAPGKQAIPGLAAHDIGACQELENEVLTLTRTLKPDRTVLVVSGDLTVLGDASEFALAQTFLRGRIQTTWKQASGLGLIVDTVIAVPGNHDHLRGQLWRTAGRSSPSVGVYPFFEPTYSRHADRWWIHHAIEVSGLSIQIGGIDSCGAPTGQLFATGSVDPLALNELEQRMQSHARPPRTHEIRLLLMHHALNHTPTRGSMQWVAHQAHKLDVASAKAVESFCHNTQTNFVLTGHLHAPDVPLSGVPLQPGTEIRCGSSLQEGSHQKLGQIFMAHLVEVVDNKRPQWTTRVFQRSPMKRSFVEQPSWCFNTLL